MKDKFDKFFSTDIKDKAFDIIIMIYVITSMMASIVLIVSGVYFTIQSGKSQIAVISSGLIAFLAAAAVSYFYIDIYRRKS